MQGSVVQGSHRDPSEVRFFAWSYVPCCPLTQPSFRIAQIDKDYPIVVTLKSAAKREPLPTMFLTALKAIDFEERRQEAGRAPRARVWIWVNLCEASGSSRGHRTPASWPGVAAMGTTDVLPTDEERDCAERDAGTRDKPHPCRIGTTVTNLLATI